MKKTLPVPIVAGLSVMVLLLATSPGSAQVPATPAPATPVPAPAAAATGAPLSPTVLEPLRAKIGDTATVEGTIAVAGESKTKTVRYLNFTKKYSEGLSLVFFAAKAGDNFTLEKLQAWVGKKVQATGKVSEFNGNLQMEITTADALKEVK